MIPYGRQDISSEDVDAVVRVLRSDFLTQGPEVEAFEAELAAYVGALHAVAVNSATSALHIACAALGIGPGDTVWTSPNSFVASANCARYCGAAMDFVDIDEQTYNLDPALLDKVFTPLTKAIIPVHLFGQMADMSPILEIASENGIPVVEDACQAHGARYKGSKAGTMGIAGCFSFYPGKNLGALGEAGAVVTSDPQLEAKIKVLRDHGQARKYFHSHIGWNARMDGIQGAVLIVKLKRLDEANERRRSHARVYDQLLGGLEEVMTPFTAPYNDHVYHIYAVRVQDRDQVLQALADKGISCAIHYPVPVHLQEAYRSLGYSIGSFPVAEKCAAEFLSLPMYPELSNQQIHCVAEELKSVVRAGQTHEWVA